MEIKSIVKEKKVMDSEGKEHDFKLVRVVGGYGFLWDGKDLDWSFTVHGYTQALFHFNFICDNQTEIDYTDSWARG